jgi:hypothetical protein
MKALISDKEIANFLVTLITKSFSDADIETALSLEYNEHELGNEILNVIEKRDSGKLHKFKDKIKGKLHSAVSNDLRAHVNKLQNFLDGTRKRKEYVIRKNITAIIETLGADNILQLYKDSNEQGFVKSTALHIDSNTELVRRSVYQESAETCFFRNMDGNEQMLLSRMGGGHPFWFIDTGYTNFLHGKQKVWHRLVRNNLHHSAMFNPPVDRLGIFESFPQSWREGGDKILIIEPGGFSARTFGIDIAQWKKEVEVEIRKYTDKKIVIREKLSKKVRQNLYKELCDDDYYCVININSNAATEAVWAGVPIITLDKHITNSISRSKISEINDLARPHLANWLCTLSYSQFTYDELIDGTASTIVKKYHV